jgi:hypothetical protein
LGRRCCRNIGVCLSVQRTPDYFVVFLAFDWVRLATVEQVDWWNVSLRRPLLSGGDFVLAPFSFDWLDLWNWSVWNHPVSDCAGLPEE